MKIGEWHSPLFSLPYFWGYKNIYLKGQSLTHGVIRNRVILR